MNCNLEYRIELFLGISELSDIFRDIILSEKDEPILNMTLIYVTHVRIYQRPLLIAQPTTEDQHAVKLRIPNPVKA